MKKIILISYVLFLVAFGIFSYTFIDPNLFYLHNYYSGFVFQKRGLTTLFFLLFVLLFFIFYFLFFWLLERKKLSVLDLKFLIGATVFILLFSYPAILSYDIFNYLASAKVLFLYKENPYIIMPIEFAGDPLLLFTHAANKVALYGPSWLILTIFPYLLGFGNFLFTLFSFKLFVALFYLATIVLFWKLSKNIISTSLFALNPLIVIESLVSGHNDIIMMFFALLSFFFLFKRRIWLAIVFLVFSILIKYATIFLLPVFIYGIWKTIKKENLNWERIFSWSFISMMVIFLLSPFREEIYPWYAIWFLTFSFLVPSNKMFLYLSLTFSLSLLLRYIPFMFLGTYSDYTLFLKTVITFLPVFLIMAYLFFKEKIWLKVFYRQQ